MKIGIRQKIIIGFGGIVFLALLIGIQSMIQFHHLGQAIDVILRENYRSVIACQTMKEALERVDSGILFTLVGYQNEGQNLIQPNITRFQDAMQIELGNITLPGEQEKADHLKTQFDEYVKQMLLVIQSDRPIAERSQTYFQTILPLFQNCKSIADEILTLNQNNMNEASIAARRQSQIAQRNMMLFLFTCTWMAMMYIGLSKRWILHPLQELLQSTEEIREGNLDLVIQSHSQDEIGRLTESFNAMTESLRRAKKRDQFTIRRSQQATQTTFKQLPAVAAIVDLEGNIEISTEAAAEAFGLKKNHNIHDQHTDWLTTLYQRALNTNQIVELEGKNKTIQKFIQNEEYFFEPTAAPIADHNQPATGVLLVFKDVTQIKQNTELKQNVISTVSHQLKTPLTSIRMALHLLLDDKLGPLNEKQTEIVVTARDDSERLWGIIEGLMDINRLESGKGELNFQSVPIRNFILESIEPLATDAKDRGITLKTDIPDDLPSVWADPIRLHHVFINLISNALRYTQAGGDILVKARQDSEWIQIQIQDSGIGIPEKYKDQVFEPFFRVPGQEIHSGAGLGLAICKEIIEAHGGKIRLAESSFPGTCIEFTLKSSGPQNP